MEKKEPFNEKRVFHDSLPSIYDITLIWYPQFEFLKHKEPSFCFRFVLNVSQKFHNFLG